MLEIFSKNGHSNESQILLNGEPVDQCTKIQITLEVNEPVRVECETIAQPVNLKINTPHGFSELMPSAEQAAKNLREFGKSFSKINRKEIKRYFLKLNYI